MNTSKKTVLIIAVAQLINYVLPLITFPLLIRAFSITQYGIWVEAGTIVGLIIAFVINGLNAATNALAVSQPAESDHIFSNALYLFIGITTIFTVAMIIGAPYLNQLMIRQPSGVLILQITAVLIVTGGFGELTALVFRLRHQAPYAAVFVVLMATARIVAVLFAVWQRDLSAFAVLYVTLQGLVSIPQLLIAYRGVKLHRFAGSTARQLLQQALSLSIVAQSNWLVMYGDRLMLSLFSTSAAVAVYAVSYQITAILVALGAPFLYSLLPNIGNRWAHGDVPGAQALIRDSTRNMVILLVPAVIGLTLVGDSLLQLLATKDFAQGWVLIAMLATGVALDTLSNSLQFLFYAQGRPFVMRQIYLQAAVLNIVANFVAIPLWSYQGAGLTTLLTFMFIFFRLWRATQMPFHLLFDIQVLWRCIGAGLIMSIWVVPIVNPTIPRLILAAVGGALIYVGGLLVLRVVTLTDFIAIVRYSGQSIGLFKR